MGDDIENGRGINWWRLFYYSGLCMKGWHKIFCDTNNQRTPWVKDLLDESGRWNKRHIEDCSSAEEANAILLLKVLTLIMQTDLHGQGNFSESSTYAKLMEHKWGKLDLEETSSNHKQRKRLEGEVGD
ncbi:transposase IS3/IS911 family protein [Striga asiatica]|uniref:Transposase IS3/IS911 family protein n=1 Tax=Striga asiatica TaxID=4170 RepID=A0A5A7R809_STRAF|nr:transposase IS3/IS911 family protein [Striga asiatica]